MKIKLGQLYRLAGTFLDRATPFMISAYIVVLCLALFWIQPKEVIGGDSPGIAYLPASILRHHTIKLDPYVDSDPLFELWREPHWVVQGVDGYYSKFSPVPSLLSLPLYAASFRINGFPVETKGEIVFTYLSLSRLMALIVITTIVVVVFHILRSLVSQPVAFGLSMIYAFSTLTWHTASGTLASQSSGELFVALSTLCLIKADVADELNHRRHLYFAGLFMSLAVASRMQLVFLALLFTAFVIVKNRVKHALWGWFIFGALPVVLMLGTYNTIAFGTPFATGYGTEALMGWTTPFLEGFFGILVSPSHGLLIYSPVFLFALFVMFILTLTKCRHWHKISMDRQLTMILCAGVFLHLIMMSKWSWWYGGSAYNQRMLEEVHPLMIILVALGWSLYGNKRWYRLCVIGSGISGFLMNAISFSFQNQHLSWVDFHRPDLIWSIADMESLYYVRQHGLADFSLQLITMLGRITVIGLMVTLAFLLVTFLWRKKATPDKCQD